MTVEWTGLCLLSEQGNMFLQMLFTTDGIASTRMAVVTYLRTWVTRYCRPLPLWLSIVTQTDAGLRVIPDIYTIYHTVLPWLKMVT